MIPASSISRVCAVAAMLAVGCNADILLPPSTTNAPPDAGSPSFCGAKTLSPWSRKTVGAGGAVSFNEIMYHPAGDPRLEWIELHNPLAVDVDLSGFRIDGAVRFDFAPGTFIAAGGFLVIAAGAYTGQLPDDDGALELWNNAGRRLDVVTFADASPWPVAAGGSGASLAKRDEDAASEPFESWTASDVVGGTPGKANFAGAPASLPLMTLVPDGATWRHFTGGADPGPQWTSPRFDDSAWPQAPANFYAPAAAPMATSATATFTADNFFAIYAGKADGSGLRLLGRDAVGDWSSAETFRFPVADDEYLFVAAWEAPGGNGGAQSLIGQVVLPGNIVLPTDPATFEWVIGPKGQCPGGALTDPAPALAAIQAVVQAADRGKTWAAPAASAEQTSPPWGPALTGVFAPGVRFIWADTFSDVSLSNTDNTYVLFRSKRPIVPARGATALAAVPTTAYFRTRFQLPADLEAIQPWIDALVDDGAVFYLNGAEVLRLRMPAGPVSASTLAATTVTDATLAPGLLVGAGALVPGENVLAVEVHQAAAPDPDLLFGASMRSSVRARAAAASSTGIAFHEVAAGGGAFWLELANRAAIPIEIGGHVIASTAGRERVLPAGTLAPGAPLLLDAAKLGFTAAPGEKLFLYAPDRKRVLDAVAVEAVPVGRRTAAPFAGGSLDRDPWLYPDVPTPGAPNVFVEHDDIVINEIFYHGPPVAGTDGTREKSPLEWVELVNRGSKPVDLGGWQLVDAIEYELPPRTVVPPGGYLVITNDVRAMRAAWPALPGSAVLGDFDKSLGDGGDNLVLRDACGNVADAVRYADGGRWPAFADGGGASLELRDPRADNAAPEAWAASDEAAASDWQTFTWEGVAAASSVGPDGVWQELVLGLLDAGEVLIDDLSVVADPAGAATPLVPDGTFEAGAAAFRLLGNHRHSEVIAEPGRPGNHVLRLVATGATEHMHNHVETTLAGGHRITNGTRYRISLRARWMGGSNQLHVRLYFNRLARTLELPLPARHGTPGARNSTAADNIGPTFRDLAHAPAVPRPFEPITVTVFAADPDGVADLQLWYAVDGDPARKTSVPMMARGDGRYAGLIPGQPAGTLVQLWVAARDGRGATSFAPARGPDARALLQVDDGLAAKNGLHNLRVLITPADLATLFKPINLMSNDLLGATVIDDERVVYYDAGVRLKSSERGRPVAARVGFALRFQPDQPFRGVHDGAMVDRSEGVNFGQREVLINQVMNHAGAVTSHYNDVVKLLTTRAPMIGPAEVQLGGFGDLLLDQQFDGGGDGVLFEYELIYYPTTTDNGTPAGYKLPAPDSVVGTAIRDLGDDKESYRLPFTLKNNRWRDDHRGLIGFAKVFGGVGPSFEAGVASVIDVDQWLRAFAFATLSGAVDNYASGSQHNADFYVRPSDGRVLYFPHDLDFYGGSPQSPIVASPDLAKLVANPARARIYYAHLLDIITTAYNGTYMARYADQLGKLLPGQDFAAHLRFIAARADYVLDTAPDAILKSIPRVPFQITTNGGMPLAVQTAAVTLDGTAWLDIAEVRRAAPAGPVALTWTSRSAWQATLPVDCGMNPITLSAIDRQGRPAGTSAIVVTRSGGGCP